MMNERNEISETVAHRIFTFALTLCLLFLFAGAANADTTPVNSFYGSYSTEVPIEVPKYHGLEPALAIVYSSAAGNGFLGQGWSLTGFSAIERASSGRGTPTYGSADIFLLDGQELVADSSMGCQYSTRIKNYSCITYGASTNSWTVVGTNGNRATYSPIYNLAQGTFRWGLSSVSDTRGNAVTYTWWCEAGADCYPSSVTYNGTVVQLYREPRPDRSTFANGSGLGSTNYRVKTIDVLVGGSRARTYALSYTTSASTSRSLLTSVQQFGRDATLDSNGLVTGGTALPPMTLQYDGGAATGFSGSNANYAPPGGWWFDVNADTTGMRMVDLNGDGLLDLLFAQYANNGWFGNGGFSAAYLNTGSGWSADVPAYHVPDGWTFNINGQDTGLQITDLNGDGLPDLLFAQYANNGWWGNGGWERAYLNTGSGWSADVASFHVPDNWTFNINGAATGLRLTDLNGDGLPDLLFAQYANNGWWGNGGWARAYLNTGSGWSGDVTSFHVPDSWTFNINGQETGLQLVDLNGDGLPDLLFAQYANNGWWGNGGWERAYLNTGSGWSADVASFHVPDNWTFNINGAPTGLQLVDLNGDNRPDLLFSQSASNGWWGNGTWQRAYLNTGAGWTIDVPAYHVPDGWLLNINGAPTGLQLADLNGDGRSDLLLSQYANNGWWGNGAWQRAYLNLGTGWSPDVPGYHVPDGWTLNINGARTGLRIVDFTGDGLPDLLFSQHANNGWWGNGGWSRAYVNRGSAPDLVTGVANGLGGTTSFSFAANPVRALGDIRMSGAFAPVEASRSILSVASTTTIDGRGASSTTSYQYQGGLWSPRERRFLGFRYIKSVIDAAGDYSEVYYHQDVGCVSKPEAEYLRDAAGNPFHYTAYTYTESSLSAGPPYTSLMTDRWQYQCDEGSACRRVRDQFAYDRYSNVISEYHWGDYDVSGDEKVVIRGYVPNKSNYVVGFPAYENTYAGIENGGSLTAGSLLLQVQYSYDGASSYTVAPTLGNRTAQRQWNNATGGFVTTQFRYDAYGNRTSTTDPLGNKSTTAHDGTYHVYPTSECDALAHCEMTSWDTTLGVKVKSTDANGAITKTAYDPLGRVVSVTSPLGAKTTTAYVGWGSPTGQYVQVTAPNGVWTQEWFDGAKRTYKNVRSDGVEIDTVFSEMSARAWKTSLPYKPLGGETAQYVVYLYDGQGRQRSVTAPDGARSWVNYASGVGYSTVQHLDALGHETVQWTNAAGKVLQTREEIGGGATTYLTTQTYDQLGHLLTQTDALGHVSTHAYNSLNQETSRSDIDLGAATFAYDASGRLNATTDAQGATVKVLYDAVGRMTTRTYPDGSKVEYKYDEPSHGASIGRLTTISDPNGSESYVYDLEGRRTSVVKCVRGECYTIGSSFDGPRARPTSITYPDGEVVAYGYDKSGRLSSLGSYVTAAGYNSSDQLLTLTYGNGAVTQYTYDSRRAWLTGTTVRNRAGSSLYQASYRYDADARLVAVSSTSDSSLNESYTYDDLHRLTSMTGAQAQTFAYDATGNLLSVSSLGTYAYSDARHPHAATIAGPWSMAYDAAGNMISQSSARGMQKLTWGYDGQLLAVDSPGGTTNYAYDGAGHRVYESTGARTSYYFGPSIEIQNGALVKYYSFGPTLVAKRDGAGTFWYHHDHLGSVRRISDDAGNPVSRVEFTAFGDRLPGSSTFTDGAAITDTFGFNGKRQDPTTFAYFEARYYDPRIGRFLSPDTVIPGEQPQALNRYAFAFNNPISNSDPSGHDPVTAAAVATDIIGAAVTSEQIITATSILGTVMTVGGMATHDARLLSIGETLLGYSSGIGFSTTLGGASSLVGAGLAAAESPLSPLAPGVKKNLGWAFLTLELAQNADAVAKYFSQTGGVAGTGWVDMGNACQALPADFAPYVHGARIVDGTLTIEGISGLGSAGLSGVPSDLANVFGSALTGHDQLAGEFLQWAKDNGVSRISINQAYSRGATLAEMAAENGTGFGITVAITQLRAVPVPTLVRMSTQNFLGIMPSGVSQIVLAPFDLVSGYTLGPILGASTGIQTNTIPGHGLGLAVNHGCGSTRAYCFN